jgi:methylmalonyl-CoA/ethylmalonyl-CoA epimerase
MATAVLSRIGQIAIRVRDVERAITTYRDRLGLPFLFQAPAIAFFQAGEIWLYLTTAVEPGFDHPASLLYFDVEDIGAAYQSLKERGIAFRSEPHAVHREPGRELWLADFEDGEDNVFALRQWVSRAPGSATE